jgi:hypothetical protein
MERASMFVNGGGRTSPSYRRMIRPPVNRIAFSREPAVLRSIPPRHAVPCPPTNCGIFIRR